MLPRQLQMTGLTGEVKVMIMLSTCHVSKHPCHASIGVGTALFGVADHGTNSGSESDDHAKASTTLIKLDLMLLSSSCV